MEDQNAPLLSEKESTMESGRKEVYAPSLEEGRIMGRMEGYVGGVMEGWILGYREGDTSEKDKTMVSKRVTGLS